MATPPPSAQLNRNINVTTHSYNSIGDTDVHAMRKFTRMKQREKRGNEAERIRPRETTPATTGIVVNCFVERHMIEANVQLGEGNAESVKD